MAELVVDYKSGTSEIKGVPEDSIMTRLKTALGEWLTFLFFPFIILSGILIFVFNIQPELVLKLGGIIVGALTLCHLNKNFDRKMKRYFAKKSGKGKRNRIVITDLKINEFILFDICNRIVDYKVTEDFSRYLSKVWIKEEHISSMQSSQGKLVDLKYNENRNIWNCHFLFEQKPEKGELFVEWI